MNHTIHRRIRRGVASATLALGVSFGVGAFALDANDILNLQAAGLDANTIVTVIRSSSEPLTITPAEVEQLRAAGVAPPVLDEICLRVGCGGGPAGPAGPGGPVGPDLQRELELQRQQEEERRRLEMERMEQERERMRQAIEAEQQRSAQVDTAFQGLAVADRAYRGGNYAQAAGMYRDFIEDVAPARGSSEYNQALAGFVRSMHAAGYRHSIRAEALEATLAGPSSAAFEEMFGILVDIANDANYLDPQFERLTDFQVGSASPAFQDEWNYFLGRFFWVYGEFPRAMELLARVAPNSDRAGQAHYLTGVMALAQGENQRANSEFREAIVAAQRSGDQDVYELANLAIARIAYEVTALDVALYHYRKIPFESPRHARAVFETAWTYTLKMDWDRAVGTLHSLHSPYYDEWFFPELYVLEAYAYLQTCNLDAAQEAILAFSEEVASLRGPLQSFIANAAGPEAFWEAIVGYYDTLGTPNQSELPIEAVRAVVADVDFRNQMRLIQALERERDRLAVDAGTLGQFGSLALAGLQSDIDLRIIDAGLKISRMLTDFSAELTDWYVKSQEVSIEVRTEILSVFDAALAGVEVDQSSSSSVFVLAADWQYWPFEGEYWIDEVDAYRADLQMLRDDSSGRCMSIDIGGDTTAQ